jgi:hypothetical protein
LNENKILVHFGKRSLSIFKEENAGWLAGWAKIGPFEF